MNKEKVLEVKNLTISFKTPNGLVRAVRNVDFDLYKGETLAIVGESGSGKSVTTRAIMGILARNAIIDDGEILYSNQDLTKLSEENFHLIRGSKIGMIFQDPLSSLNPIMKIGKQITEAMLVNGDRIKGRYMDLFHKEYHDYLNLIARIEFVKNELKNKIYELNTDKSIDRAEKKKIISELKTKHHEQVKELHVHLPELKEKYLAKKADAKKQVKLEKDEILQEKHSVFVELKRELAEQKKILDATPKNFDKYNAAKEELKALKAQYSKMRSEFKVLAKDASNEFKLDEKKEALENMKQEFEAKKQALKLMPKAGDAYQAALDNFNAVKEKVDNNSEAFRRKFHVTKKEAYEKAISIMNEVGIPEPEKRFSQYPFQFSGGMRQRIVIAIALTANPELLICDEPTTALDVTIQGQILNLIKDIKNERELSVIFITHDLGVVANMADRVAVMYAGKIVEYGSLNEIFYDPKHPYTWALLSSVPDLDTTDKLLSIPGTPPDMLFPPKGDAFADRNQYALKIDFEEQPPFFKISDTHYAATWLLHPDAPKIPVPNIVKERIERFNSHNVKAVTTRQVKIRVKQDSAGDQK